jgi:hypothetical protein
MRCRRFEKRRDLNAVLMKKTTVAIAAVLIVFCACKSTRLESTAATLNRDLDLEKSLYQFKVSEDEQRRCSSDATLRADVERIMASKLNAPANVTEIRVFETRPDLRREAWVVKHNDELMAFDVIFRAAKGSVDFTVEGPMMIEGAL